MNLELDTISKTVTITGDINVIDLKELLNNLFPNNLGKEYKIILKPIIINNPIYIPYNPVPYNPWVTIVPPYNGDQYPLLIGDIVCAPSGTETITH